MCWKGTTRWLYFSRSNHVSWLAACELQKNIPEWYADFFFPFPPAWSGKLKKSPFRPQDNISAQKSRNKAIFKPSDGEDVGFSPPVCTAGTFNFLSLHHFSSCHCLHKYSWLFWRALAVEGPKLHTLHSHPINTMYYRREWYSPFQKQKWVS